MDGFDTQEQGDIRVSVGIVLEVRFVMTIGATETITVRAEPPLGGHQEHGIGKLGHHRGVLPADSVGQERGGIDRLRRRRGR